MCDTPSENTNSKKRDLSSPLDSDPVRRRLDSENSMTEEMPDSKEDKVPPPWALVLHQQQVDLVNQKSEEIQVSIKALTDKIEKVEDDNKALRKHLTKTDAKVLRLENKCAHLTSELDKIKSLLLKQEILNKKCNLLFYGCPEGGSTERAECVSLITGVVRDKLGMDTSNLHIGKCYRIGLPPKAPRPPRPRAILVSFPTMSDRDKIWAQKAKLKDTGYFISPDLPREVEQRRLKLLPTFKKAKSMPKYTKSTFLNEDRLSIDKKVYTVATMGDLPDDLNPALDATQTKDGVTLFFTKFSPLSNHLWKPLSK